MNELTNRARQILKDKRGAEPLKTLVAGVAVRWKGSDGKLKGPVLIEGVFQVDGQDWVWFTFDSQNYLLNSRMIV